jgi:hypothetical protein
VSAQLFDGTRPERVARGNKNLLLALLHGMAWHGMAGPASPSLRTAQGMGSICRCGAEQTMPAVLRCAALRTN